MSTFHRMDAKWFKDQQKRVGVTADDIAREMGRVRSNVSHILNGHQPMSPEWAKAFAKVLQVPLATILEKAGVTDQATSRQLTPGFSDSDISPWVPQQRTPSMEERRTQGVANYFGAKPGVDIWQVKTDDLAGIGYLRGDFILVDTFQAERTKPGDVVMAQIYDRNGGATTVLRQHQPPVLVHPKDMSVHVIDGNNVVIMGKITASWRTN